MNWLYIPLKDEMDLHRQTYLAVYKCTECGEFGHIELDCLKAPRLRAELARREACAAAIAAEKARRTERAEWLAGGIVFLLIVGIFLVQMWMKGN